MYDSIGRPQTITYTEDATSYPFTYAYNNQGTVDTVTYPVSTAGYQFVLKNVYDSYGFLSAEKDNAAGTVFWSLTSANDSSLPTVEQLGNGAKVSTGYTPWTNEVISRAEGTGTSTNNLQNLTYDWDLAGNLHDRIDHLQTLTEQFSYDSMNRLLGSTLTVAANAPVTNLTVAYDAAGDIMTKSDVGSAAYTYDTVHKHAVKTAGTWTMGYDANGNMTSRAGGALTWASYNLPLTIAYQSNTTQFAYNAAHQRYKQVANYAGTTETTHYVGGLLEIMTRGTGPTEYRHQIPAGSNSVVYTRRTDGTTGYYYATSDHLGSADLVMDGSANVLARESFTPFGARRGSNWQGTPSTSDYTAFGNSTRKGFTGHEMLDSVSLVHMNGRVYDPFLGRVLSADSVVQTLAASESINPYTYAWNDPLKYTDPSGHSLLGDILGVLATALVIIFAPELGLPAIDSELGAVTAMVAGFAGGFVGAYVSTGSLSAALTAGLITGIAAGVMASTGLRVLSGEWTRAEGVIANVAVGCLQAAASGGNCGRGAMSAAFAIAARPLMIKFPSLAEWSNVPEAVQAGLIGGEAAKLAGGKFEDGFSSAAVQYLTSPQPRQNADDHTSVLGQLGRDVKGIAVDIYAVTVGQLGALYVFIRWDLPSVGTDLANGALLQAMTDFGKTLYDLILPHYGNYGGSGWGMGEPYKPWGRPLNQVDYACYVHDLDGASGAWASNAFANTPGYLPAGPFGMAYQIVGLIPFTIAGAFGH